MNTRTLGIGCLVLAGLLARCEPDNAFFFKNNDSVVFLGDSITQQKLYTTYLEAYTLTRFPDRRFRFRNVGWGGDTSWLRKRFKTDEKALFSATGAVLDEMDDPAAAAQKPRPLSPYARLRAVESTALPAKAPSRTLPLRLTGDMTRYTWSINGKPLKKESSSPFSHAR